jgi:hypothetical protein
MLAPPSSASPPPTGQRDPRRGRRPPGPPSPRPGTRGRAGPSRRSPLLWSSTREGGSPPHEATPCPGSEGIERPRRLSHAHRARRPPAAHGPRIAHPGRSGQRGRAGRRPTWAAPCPALRRSGAAGERSSGPASAGRGPPSGSSRPADQGSTGVPRRHPWTMVVMGTEHTVGYNEPHLTDSMVVVGYCPQAQPVTLLSVGSSDRHPRPGPPAHPLRGSTSRAGWRPGPWTWRPSGASASRSSGGPSCTGHRRADGAGRPTRVSSPAGARSALPP